MKEYQKINLYTNTSANPFLLFFIWLLLTILPFFIISESLDYYLKESEKRILSKTKIELLNEINEFRHNLTSDNYIHSKLSNFTNIISKNNYNAFLLSQELEKLTKSGIVAVFYYNSSNNFFDSYINKEFSQELGIPSKYSMKNLLLDYALIDEDDSKRARSKIYFEQLLSAGKINLKSEVATPILSGKNKLGKMLGYYKILNNNSDKQMFLCLFRIKDIPLKEITKYAIENTKNKNFKRELINSKNLLKIKSDSDLLDNLYFKFNQNERGDLSIFSKASDELLLRLGTKDSYYPLNLNNLIENEPILKVTSSKSNLEHPMRGIINKLRFPTLLLIMFTTIVIVRIGIFGYTARIRILGRVILCVLAGVLLPFTSFILTAYYNQYFEEEYSENEIQLYTQIQTEIIGKSIEAYINNKEYAILDLRNKISGLPREEVNKILNDWIIDSGASIISYNYLDKNEIIINSSSKDQLIQLGKEAKSLIDICLDIYFSKIDLSQINSVNDIKEKYTFEPKTLTKVLSNFGEITQSVPNEPDALYSMFPIFENENTAQKIVGSILIKFDTYKIVRELPKINPDFFKEIYIDNYIIRNAVIPINKNSDLPNSSKVLYTEGFDYHSYIDKINKILTDKSFITWKADNSINSGTYSNSINSIIISTATRNANNIIYDTKLEIKYIIIYVLFMILTLSIILSAIIVTPIKLLQKSSKIIAKGIYTNKTHWNSGDEFEKLSLAFNEMTDALAQKELMTNYVSKDIVNEVSNKNEVMLQPGGEKIPVTVLFCTIKGEKELSDYSPEEVTKIISCLIDTVDEISSIFNGQIDKLIEDTVMIVFRQIDKKDNIVLKACQAALAINERLQKNLPDFKINMGIASGDAVSGKIGSRNGKLDYTVIGNPVNLAARLKAQAYKAKTTGILLCPNSIRQLHGAGRLKFIERISIKGRTNRTFPLYELISLR